MHQKLRTSHGKEDGPVVRHGAKCRAVYPEPNSNTLAIVSRPEVVQRKLYGEQLTRSFCRCEQKLVILQSSSSVG